MILGRLFCVLITNEKEVCMVKERYSEHYSVTKLIEKVGKASKTASSELLRSVVTLYVILLALFD